MYYSYKMEINYRVMVLITWCGRWKSLHRGGKLKATTQFPIFFKNSQLLKYWEIHKYFLDLLDNPQILTLEFLLRNMTHIIRPTSSEI